MRRGTNREGVSGALEELPALLVVLVGISLFAVTAAHAYSGQADAHAHYRLQEDCQAFSRMLRTSDLLCAGNGPGEFDRAALNNLSGERILKEFDPGVLGFDYEINIMVFNPDTGGTSPVVAFSSDVEGEHAQVASFASPVNVDDFGRVGAGTLTVSIWRAG